MPNCDDRREVGHLHTLAGLQSLDLSETQVTDAGLLHLEALRNLQDLTLQQTAVTETGVDRLKAALRHQQPRLTILW